ncbi:MAG: hypothetical protein AAGF71_09295 [Pseudomonadota bacterium]
MRNPLPFDKFWLSAGLCLFLTVGGSVSAEDALPSFNGTDRYRVIGPYADGLLIQTASDRTFLCDTDVANIVLLTNCRPVLTPEEVEFFVAREALLDKRSLIREERARLRDLPIALFERAARRTLSLRGCQVDLSRSTYLRRDVLPVFASELNIPDRVHDDLTGLLDQFFTETLDLLLRDGEVTYDRATAIVRLVECDQ